MGDLFRVIVFRETPDENGDYAQETVIEFAAPREMLAQFAPQAVAAALGDEPPKMAMEGPTETQEQATQRRKRRTKAEMEAARAADNDNGGPITLAEVMPTVTTTFESAKPIPVETPTSGSGYRPFG